MKHGEKQQGAGPRAKMFCSTEGLPPALCVWCVCEVAQSCLTLCDPVDCSLPGSSVHGIFQARVLEWVAVSFSRGSSPPRDWTQVCHIAGRRFIVRATLSRWHLYVPWLKKLTQNLDHHTQLCWEEKWGRQGICSYSGVLCFKGGVLGFWKRLSGSEGSKGRLWGLRRRMAQLALVLVALATRWHPYFGIFAFNFNLRKNLFKSLRNKCSLDLGFIIYEADFISCLNVLPCFRQSCFDPGIVIINVGVSLPPLFLSVLEPGVKQWFSI